VVFLVTPETKIITSQILNAANNGRYGVAFAYCTVLTVIVLAAFGVIRLIIGGTANLNRVAMKSPTTSPMTSEVSS
jgi:iron(III) transport system permease protein